MPYRITRVLPLVTALTTALATLATLATVTTVTTVAVAALPEAAQAATSATPASPTSTTVPPVPTATTMATGTGPPTPAPSRLGPPHRLFYANAHRESLTGATDAKRRMKLMVRALNRSGADLGVLVEIDGAQPRTFRKQTRGTWGLISRGRSTRNAVIYQTATWTPIARRSIPTYWNGGRRTRTPLVILRHTSGDEVAVIGLHNPRDNERLRAVNNRRVLAAIRTLGRDKVSVLVAGDFNTGRPAVCLYTAPPHRLTSAAHRGSNACRNQRSTPIDQAFATPELRLQGYRRTPSAATDHGAVYSIGFRVPRRR